MRTVAAAQSRCSVKQQLLLSPWESVDVHTEGFKSDHATFTLQCGGASKPWCPVEKCRHQGHILCEPSYRNSPGLADPQDKMQIGCVQGPEKVGMGTDCLVGFFVGVGVGAGNTLKILSCNRV